MTTTSSPSPAGPRAAPGRARGARRWWLLSFALMALIWYLSSSADTPGPPLAHPLDWIAHLVAYLSLGFALGRASGRPGLALVVAVWWGALDEVHQAFVAGREAGVQDWLFDLLGAGLGVRLAARRAGGAEVSAVAVLSDSSR